MKDAPDIMRKLGAGSPLIKSEWRELIEKRVWEIVPLFREYTLPHLGSLACLSAVYGKNDDDSQFLKIGDDHPESIRVFSSDGATQKETRMKLSTPGLFFWPKHCFQYGDNLEGPEAYPIKRTCIKRFFGIRGDLGNHWVIGWVSILPKEKNGRVSESAVGVWTEDVSHRSRRKTNPMTGVINNVLEHTGMTEPELIIILGSSVTMWEESQRRKYERIRALRYQMSAENEILKKIGA
jgi:hypothetical protein